MDTFIGLAMMMKTKPTCVTYHMGHEYISYKVHAWSWHKIYNKSTSLGRKFDYKSGI